MSSRGRRKRTPREYGQMVLAFVQQEISLPLRLRDYWQDAARREGYTRPEDAIVCVFRETNSIEQTARRLGFDRRCISRKLRALKEPVNGPGGSNNPYGRAGKPKRKSTRL